MRPWVFALLAYAAVVLDAEYAHVFDIRGVRPDFLVLVLVYGGLYLGARVVTIAGFLMGLVSNSAFPEYLGLSSLGLTIVGFTTGGVWDHLVKANVFVQFGVLFVATLLRDFIYYVVYYRHQMDIFRNSFLPPSVLGAAYTAALGIVVFVLARVWGWRAIAGDSLR